MKRLSILGAGWLGLAVAKHFHGFYDIQASTTQTSKLDLFKTLGFEGFLIDENQQESIGEFLTCDVLLICIPPSKCQHYTSFLSSLCAYEEFQSISHVIFISSTSVYDQKEGVFSESHDIKIPASTLVYEGEKVLQNKVHTILRCTGLMGKDRVAGKYFAHKNVLDGKNKVNHVHQLDVIRVIDFVLEHKLKGIYNVCAPLHPTKEEVYTHNASCMNFERPIFKNGKELNRIICSKKLQEEGFEYHYPNPLYFYP